MSLDSALRETIAPLIRETVADAVLELLDGRQQGASPVLTRTEAAAYLKCSLTTLDKLTRRNGLPCHLLGDSRRFIASELEAWVASRGGPR